ncbi:hypothetical protein Hanom_Chr10g00925161 [Helianthus anomalus]
MFYDIKIHYWLQHKILKIYNVFNKIYFEEKKTKCSRVFSFSKQNKLGNEIYKIKIKLLIEDI